MKRIDLDQAAWLDRDNGEAGKAEPTTDFVFPNDEPALASTEPEAALDLCAVLNVILDGNPTPQIVYRRCLALSIVLAAYNSPSNAAELAKRCGISRQHGYRVIASLRDTLKTYLIERQADSHK